MGDRCYVQMTMRKTDVPLFAQFVGAEPDEQWFDYEDELDNPELTDVSLHEANYALLDARQAAAEAGIPFFGTHDAGSEYGPGGFVSLHGQMFDVSLSHDGYLILALDDDLKPVDADDLTHLRAYTTKLKAVKRLFRMEVEDGEQTDDQPAGGATVPAGVCAA